MGGGLNTDPFLISSLNSINQRRRKMGKYLYRTLVLTVAIGVFLTLGVKKEAMAEMHINLNIGFPSLFEFHAPPSVVAIPGTYVYLVPDIGVDIFFYHGYWYRPHNNRWYRARSYNGHYAPLAFRHVPCPLLRLPPHYRNVPRGYHRISYRQVNRNWRRWEREKHWNRDRAWREGWKEPRRNGGERYRYEGKRAEYRNARESHRWHRVSKKWRGDKETRYSAYDRGNDRGKKSRGERGW
jgi:hypothetical protein